MEKASEPWQKQRADEDTRSTTESNARARQRADGGESRNSEPEARSTSSADSFSAVLCVCVVVRVRHFSYACSLLARRCALCCRLTAAAAACTLRVEFVERLPRRDVHQVIVANHFGIIEGPSIGKVGFLGWRTGTETTELCRGQFEKVGERSSGGDVEDLEMGEGEGGNRELSKQGQHQTCADCICLAASDLRILRLPIVEHCHTAFGHVESGGEVEEGAAGREGARAVMGGGSEHTGGTSARRESAASGVWGTVVGGQSEHTRRQEGGERTEWWQATRRRNTSEER